MQITGLITRFRPVEKDVCVGPGPGRFLLTNDVDMQCVAEAKKGDKVTITIDPNNSTVLKAIRLPNRPTSTK